MAARKKAAAKKKAAVRKASAKKAATRKKAAARKPKEEEPTTAVQAAPSGAVATMDQMMAAAAGAGMENITTSDLQIPMLRIAQALTPGMQDGSLGAEVGMVFNTLSNELYNATEEAVCVLRSHYEKKVFEFKPRESGGGLVTVHDDPNAARGLPKNAKGTPINNAGNEMIEIGQVYCLVFNPHKETWEQLLVPMSGSNWRSLRSWNSLCTMFRPDGWTAKEAPPTWGRYYYLYTEYIENPKGAFYRYLVEPGEPLEDTELFQQAQGFYEACVGGSVSARPEDMSAAAAAPEDEVAGEEAAAADGEWEDAPPDGEWEEGGEEEEGDEIPF